MTKYPDSVCEEHKDVRTSEPVCLVCMQEEIKRLRKLVAIARLHFAEMDAQIDSMDQITFAEQNGLYDEYLNGEPWEDVFAKLMV